MTSVNVKNEVEVKLRVADVDAMRRLLRRLGASTSGRVHEMNTLYDTPRGRFRRRGHLLRLRVVRVRSGHGEAAGVLTYKGPTVRPAAGPEPAAASRRAARGRYKVREEIEVAIPSPEGLRAILGAVGLVPAFRYEKFRTTYRLRGAPSVLIELDETPVGAFLELEGAPRAIDRAAKLLGYGHADYITKSYLGIHLESCRRRGVPQRDMLFRSGSARPSPTPKK